MTSKDLKRELLGACIQGLQTMLATELGSRTFPRHELTRLGDGSAMLRSYPNPNGGPLYFEIVVKEHR